MEKNQITFTTGCAISRANYFVSSNLDELDTWDLLSKIFIYKNSEKNGRI